MEHPIELRGEIMYCSLSKKLLSWLLGWNSFPASGSVASCMKWARTWMYFITEVLCQCRSELRIKNDKKNKTREIPPRGISDYVAEIGFQHRLSICLFFQWRSILRMSDVRGIQIAVPICSGAGAYYCKLGGKMDFCLWASSYSSYFQVACLEL